MGTLSANVLREEMASKDLHGGLRSWPHQEDTLGSKAATMRVLSESGKNHNQPSTFRTGFEIQMGGEGAQA